MKDAELYKFPYDILLSFFRFSVSFFLVFSSSSCTRAIIARFSSGVVVSPCLVSNTAAGYHASASPRSLRKRAYDGDEKEGKGERASYVRTMRGGGRDGVLFRISGAIQLPVPTVAPPPHGSRSRHRLRTISSLRYRLNTGEIC